MNKNYIWIFCIFIVNCGSPIKDFLPIEKINSVKHTISQALYFGADKYSEQNYQTAVDKFLEAQNMAFEEQSMKNKETIQTLLDESENFAILALKESIIQYADSILDRLNFFIAESQGIETLNESFEKAESIIPVIKNFKSELENEQINSISYEEFKNLSADFLNFLDNSLFQLAKNQLEKARSLFEISKKALEEIDKSLLEANTDLKTKFTSIEEIFQAEKEELISAELLFSEKDFPRTIEKTKEVFRLDAIIQEQLEDLSILALSIASVKKMEEEEIEMEEEVVEVAEKNQKTTNSWHKYKVQKRIPADCLWRIADRKYNNPYLWKRIYEANKDKIKNPDLIYIGQILVIPPKKGPIFKKKKKEKPEKVKPS